MRRQQLVVLLKRSSAWMTALAFVSPFQRGKSVFVEGGGLAGISQDGSEKEGDHGEAVAQVYGREKRLA